MNNHPYKHIIENHPHPFVFAGIQNFKSVLFIALQPFNHNHNYDVQVCRIHNILVWQKEAVTCAESAELHHFADIFPGLSDGFGAEDDPAENGKEEGNENLQSFAPCG